MPEIKNQFTGGKMNKDVDERLVPKGEYRDAMNIQVSTSEGSDVATIQNILGNVNINLPSDLAVGSICVGSVADEKNDAFYWLVKEPDTPAWSSFVDSVYSRRDIIFEHKNNTVSHVFVDKSDTTILIPGGGNPNTGDIPTQSTAAFNAINVGDTISGFIELSTQIILTNETFTVLSVDATNETFNIGNYVNASLGWVNHQQGEVAININARNSALNFPNNLITGINIVDDMLFWTDNISEPKKINITRSKIGTNPNGLQHTRLINQAQGINPNSNILIKEEHITVIRKAPLKAPCLDMVGERPGNSNSTFTADFTGFGTGAVLDIPNAGGLNYEVGDVLIIKENFLSLDIFPITNHDIRVVINSIGVGNYSCTVLSILSGIQVGPQTYSSDLDKSYDKLYMLKFPRFAIRYKYTDGEYSTFGPFSEPAFMAGAWNNSGTDGDKISYLPNSGYNLGMENKLRELTLKRIIPGDIPLDVKQIDILYKESNSPTVYTVDEIKPTDTYWTSNSYNIKQETIKATLPSNQLLRPWDNVPKKALAQELIGSRIVYANYEQNYNLNNFRADFDVILRDRTNSNIKSIKSLRNYQIGIVYTDTYNRQTPVLTDISGSLAVSKLDSAKSTYIETKVNHTPPNWATHHKFFIKETSTEYYNLPLDRYFNAEDGNIWLSFASNDRNKVDLETTLYLKKRYNSNDAETTLEKYKIIDIQNEAPEFIKTRRSVLGRVFNQGQNGLTSGGAIFTSASGKNPVEGEIELRCDIPAFDNTILDNFHKRHNSPSATGAGGGALVNNPLFIRITSINSSGVDQGKKTNWYEVDSVSKGDANNTNNVAAFYLIRLKKAFGDDALWTNQNIGISGNSAGQLVNLNTVGINLELVLEVGQDTVQNTSVFQGRFFAKVLLDLYLKDAIVDQSEYQNVQVISTANCGYIKDFVQEDPGDDWGFSKANHQAEINTFNTSGFSGSQVARNCPIPDTPFPVDAYWSHSVWQKIRKKLDALNSRWVIDEAFAVAEEPLWNYYGQAGTTGQDPRQETWSCRGTFDPLSAGTSWINKPFPTLYAGYNSESWGGQVGWSSYVDTGIHNAPSTTYLHNSTPLGQPVPGIPNTLGLGHGPGINLSYEDSGGVCSVFDPNYEYFSIGGGINNSSSNKTIDISYVGPGDNGKVNFMHTSQNAVDTETSNSPNSNLDKFGSFIFWNHAWTISNSVVGSDAIAQDAGDFGNQLVAGTIIRFKNDPNLMLYKIKNVKKFYKRNYAETQYSTEYPFSGNGGTVNVGMEGYHTAFPGVSFNMYTEWFNGAHFNRRLTFRLTLESIDFPGADIGIDSTGANIGYDPLFGENTASPTDIVSITCPIEVVTVDYLESLDVPFPLNPAVFETEPKEETDLNIFHEISDTLPLQLVGNDGYSFAPVGSVVTTLSTSAFGVSNETTVVGWNGDIVELADIIVADNVPINARFTFTRCDGSYTIGRFIGLADPIISGPSDSSFFAYIDISVTGDTVGLGWHNCYSFGNGVESNRIRDTFNSVFVDKGSKVSTTIEEGYEQERRKYGLIYSGLYNSTSGVNNLNQFIQAEKITKEINPTYGSIQRLHTRDSDLVTLCEDKVLKILANKDAVFNADGNTQLTATASVLGQTIPFGGEYGISTNPESFASESYRAYFTDKVRGAVMRLSKDGLTPISDHGMKDWFRDNLKLSNNLIGSYDDKKDEYNITLADINKTVSFKEDVKGWVSFKSFFPENGISCANEYYTFKNGNLWKHHDETPYGPGLGNRNTFHGGLPTPSSFKVVLNDAPGTVKTFHTLNYEGTQSKVDALTNYNIYIPGTANLQTGTLGIIDPNYSGGISDGEYYNLTAKDGWYVENIHTDLESGGLNEFIEKEGKWFNYIKGKVGSITDGGNITSGFDNADFSFQGLGMMLIAPIITSVYGCTDDSTNTDVNGNVYNVYVNYDPLAEVSDGSCQLTVLGCTDSNATNYDATVNYDDGSCIVYGCLDSNANNTSLTATIHDQLDCTYDIYGCMVDSPYDPVSQTGGVLNYDPLATIPCNGVGGNYPGFTPIPCVVSGTTGLMQTGNGEFQDSFGNYGGCCCQEAVIGCMDENASDYNPMASVSGIGACSYEVLGCMTSTACNYDPTATQDDGSCNYCGDPFANNFDGYDANDMLIGVFTPIASCDNGCVYCVAPTNLVVAIPESPISMLTNVNIVMDLPAVPPGAVVSNFTVEYSSDGGVTFTTFTSAWTPNGMNLSTGTTGVFLQISGLTAGTDYTFRVTSNCSAGTSLLNPTWSTTSSTTATGSTQDPQVQGCMDATACNFNPFATYDLYVSVCDFDICMGCTDPTYNEFCNTCWDATNQVVVNDGSGGPWPYSDNANLCLTQDIFGCTDNTMFNYDPAATIDDGSCVPIVLGCTDPTQSNYGGSGNTNGIFPYANTDDGSCIPFTTGCTDPAATNYNPSVNTDDGSCLYPGCTDPTAINYGWSTIPGDTANPNAWPSTFDFPSNFEVITTTGNTSLGYVAGGGYDDGSCNYTPPIPGCTYGDGNILLSGSTIADSPGVLWGSVAIGANPFAYTYDFIYTNMIGIPAEPTFEALNYNPAADAEDGSCVWDLNIFGTTGCTDPTADNYNPDWTDPDDDSCYALEYFNGSTTGTNATMNLQFPTFKGSNVYCDTTTWTGCPALYANYDSAYIIPKDASTGNLISLGAINAFVSDFASGITTTNNFPGPLEFSGASVQNQTINYLDLESNGLKHLWNMLGETNKTGFKDAVLANTSNTPVDGTPWSRVVDIEYYSHNVMGDTFLGKHTLTIVPGCMDDNNINFVSPSIINTTTYGSDLSINAMDLGGPPSDDTTPFIVNGVMDSTVPGCWNPCNPLGAC